MSSVFQPLNAESTLLMYVADELPADARRDFEQALAGDAALRRQLEELQSAYAGVQQALAGADAHERLALPEGTAARRIGNAVRSWHARRLASPAQKTSRSARFPWWAYPLAGAAMITIALATYWAKQSDDPKFTRLLPLPTNRYIDEDSAPGAGGVEVAQASLDGYPAMERDESDNVLDVVEAKLYAMSEPSHDDMSHVLYNIAGGAESDSQ